MQALSTRQAAEKVGLSQDTLRWYERIGLLERIPRGSDGRRRFGERDLSWLTLITRLRATGMPVAQMREYAELVRHDSGVEQRLALLEEHRERMERLRADLDACTALLETKIDHYRRLAAGTERQR
jgi:DNA-binding transcriptional MerR regulator